MPGVDAGLLREAAALIRRGRLVAFPTETVYGLGANALDPAAIERIYRAKERPSTSPLIVHVDSIDMARSLAAAWSDAAELLAALHWPGPLTLVVPKAPQIPDEATAGLPTVGLRMPAHPVALDLIQAAGVPIAAPSANRFMQLSPTTAAHVAQSLGDRVDLILDGGATPVGIESTVLALRAPRPVLLRPGMISREELEQTLGPIDVVTEAAGAHASPGLHARHYSPRTPLYLATPPPRGDGVWLAYSGETVRNYAANLYARLHELDQLGRDWIAVELPPDTPPWAGVRDRLRRAAAKITGDE